MFCHYIKTVLPLLYIYIGVCNSQTISSYIVNTEIKLRYSQTTIESTISNSLASAVAHTFEAIIPDSAILSGCYIDEGGQIANRSLGHKSSASSRTITLWVRNANMISIPLTLRARSELKVVVTYDQILERKKSHYYHTAYINNNLIGRVGELQIITNVDEPDKTPLGFVCVPFNQRDSEKIYRSPSNVEVVWRPTRNSDSSTPCSVSQYTVQYGFVGDGGSGNGTNPGEDIIVIEDFFFHVFVPNEIVFKPLRKHIIYVLDVSGSMSGTLITQLKAAMQSTLGVMKPDDYLNIITFSDRFTHWKGSSTAPVAATAANVLDAKNFVSGLVAGGLTYINGVFVQTFNLVKTIRDRNLLPSGVETMIFFLTDGSPTDGSTADISANVKNLNSVYKIPTCSIGLGLGTSGSVVNFLNTLSLQNYGKFLNILAGGDAGADLRDFYNSLSTPVISNLQFEYSSDDFTISELTTSTFPTVGQGVDIKICGRLTPKKPGNGPFKLTVTISGNSRDGPFQEISHVWISATKSRNNADVQVAEKMFAQLKIKQLVDNHIATGNAAAKTESQNLSIQKGFVTTYTTMTVKQPSQTVTQTIDPIPIVSTTASNCAIVNDITNGVCANRNMY